MGNATCTYSFYTAFVTCWRARYTLHFQTSIFVSLPLKTSYKPTSSQIFVCVVSPFDWIRSLLHQQVPNQNFFPYFLLWNPHNSTLSPSRGPIFKLEIFKLGRRPCTWLGEDKSLLSHFALESAFLTTLTLSPIHLLATLTLWTSLVSQKVPVGRDAYAITRNKRNTTVVRGIKKKINKLVESVCLIRSKTNSFHYRFLYFKN